MALSPFKNARLWISLRADWMAARARKLVTDPASPGLYVICPDAAGRYTGLWPADLAYAARGCAPKALLSSDLTSNFRWLMDMQQHANPDPTGISGRVPNARMLDGTVYWTVRGTLQPLSDVPYLVDIAHCYWQRTGSLALYLDYADRLLSALCAQNRSSATGLLTVPFSSPHSPWGFADVVKQTGDNLMGSLLASQAWQQLGEMATAAGHKLSAAIYMDQAMSILQGLDSLRDPSGYYYACSDWRTQPDIWGTAFAVYIGALTPEQQAAACSWLALYLPDYSWKGHVKHTLGSWPAVWERSGTYQDGGFWGLPVGWVAYAVAKADRAKAEQLVVDFELEARTVNAGSDGPYEYVGGGSPLYVPSAAACVPALRAMA